MLRRDLSCAVLAVAACFLSMPAALWAAGKPTQDDARTVALKAAAFVKDNGLDAARKAFDTDGEFKFGEIYVNVISDKGVRLIYPPAPAGENVDALEAQDIDGKYLIKDIITLAQTKGEGWTQYRWTNPETRKIGDKVTFVKAVPERGVIVYVGIYK